MIAQRPNRRGSAGRMFPNLKPVTNLEEDNFGFIKDGPCPEQPNLACGFDAWILAAHAGPIEPTRTFFNAIRARNVSVFFITDRRDSQRDATLLNLDHAGFQGWTKLVTRPDNDTNHSIVPFKSGERAKIQAAGYTIIATLGDQQSDIDGGAAECSFKLPNPSSSDTTRRRRAHPVRRTTISIAAGAY